jgi:serine/threonine protein kinase
MSAKEGWLSKQSGLLKSWQKRWYSIQGHTLYYSEKPGKKESGTVDIATLTDIGLAPECKKQPAIKYTVASEGKVTHLVAESTGEATAWVEALKKAKPAGGTTAAPAKPTTAAKKIGFDDFESIKVIGRGTFGKVELVRSKIDRKLYAMKTMEKKLLEETEQIGQTLLEKNVLLKLVHPFLVGAYATFQSPQNIYMVLDYVPGGELFKRLQEEGKFNEERTRLYTAEIALGLGFLHSKGFIYRDLKPENILVDQGGHLRITDFGLVKGSMSNAKATTTTFCGTPEYIAPEMLQQEPYTKSVDWWSLGILVFEMLSGLPPFYDENTNKMYRMILQDDINYPAGISAAAKDFIGALLDRNPTTRLGAGEADVEELKGHAFFAGLKWADVEAKKAKPEWVPDIKGDADTHLFDAEFTDESVGAGKGDAMIDPSTQAQFQGFTCTAESAVPE